MKRSTQISLGTLIALGLITGFSGKVWAQTTSVNPLEDFQSDNNTDPFSNRGSDQAGGVMNLIHRAIQNNGAQSLDDFNDAQKDNLDEAAAAFRAQQQRRLNQTQPTSTAADTTVPAPVNSNNK